MAEKAFTSDDIGDGPSSQTMSVGKYFLSVTEGGKQYSICLITDCCRRFEGNNIDDLKTHLNVAHYMKLYSAPSTTVDDDMESTSSYLVTSIKDEEDPIGWLQEGSENAPEEEQSTSEIPAETLIDLQKVVSDEHAITETTAKHKDVRDYFHVFTENNKAHAKCLVANCQLTLSGNHSGNMFKHLKAAHKMDILPRKLSQIARKQTRKYFRTMSENGKMFSKCLIRGCNFRTVSALMKDFATHLGSAHNMKLFSMSIGRFPSADECLADKSNEMEQNEYDGIVSSSRATERALVDANIIPVQANATNTSNDVRNFFRVFTENGKIFSKCLVNECELQLSGNHSHNMLKHLRRAHKMIDLQPRGRRRDFIRFPDQTNETETTNVREFFEAMSENGKIYSKCLVTNCELRLSGNHLGNMMKHLRRAHKMSLMPGRRGKNGKKPPPNLITLDQITPASVSGSAVISAGEENAIMLPQTDIDVSSKFRTLKPSYARKYFRSFMENSKFYSECLVQDCNVRLDGNSSAIMMTHIKSAHNEGNLQLRPIPQKKKHHTHKFFRAFIENGIEYSECLICNRPLRGNHRGNLSKHLQRSHNIAMATHRNETSRIQSGRDPNQTRQYFRTFTLDGRIYSECLAGNCNSRLRGKHLGSLFLHLQRLHKNLFTDALQDVVNVSTTALPDKTVSTSVSADESRNVESATETAEPQMTPRKKPKQKTRYITRKYFRTHTECGLVYSECLVENCGQRLRGKHLGNLAKHLIRRHNYDMINLYEECPDYDATLKPIHAEPIDGENELTTPLLSEIIATSVNGDDYENEESHNVENVFEKAERPKSVSESWSELQGDSYATNSGDGDARREDEEETQSDSIEKLKDVRDYFRINVKNGKVYSTCLVNGCELRLSGNHSNNMLEHLQRAHQMMDIMPRKLQQNTLDIVRPTKLKGRYLSRKYFRTIADDGQIYSECLIEHCKRRLRGQHLGNLSQHLQRRHNMRNLYPSSTDYQSDEDSMEIDALQDDDEEHSSNNSQMADANVNIRTISPSVGEEENQNEDGEFQGDEYISQTSNGRKYFETIKEGGKTFSKCLVENCNRLMTGNHLSNLKKHLLRAHNIVVVREEPPVHAKICRLCFKKHDRLLKIFHPKLNIAAIIRLHFAPTEVKSAESFPTYETISISCLHFHSRSVRTISCRRVYAKNVGQNYRNSIIFILP